MAIRSFSRSLVSYHSRVSFFNRYKTFIPDTFTKDVDRIKLKLFFHKKHSDKAVVTNNGRTLISTSENADASAVTHRPLLDDEVFTVRFDKRRDKTYPGFAIGVTTHSPDNFDFPDNLYTLKTGTWMLFESHIYQNSSSIRQNYLKTSLLDLKIGQTIGVMKNKYGNLHFFIDGEDQGFAVNKIPDTVYGAFQVYHDGAQGTIVDA